MRSFQSFFLQFLQISLFSLENRTYDNKHRTSRVDFTQSLPSLLQPKQQLSVTAAALCPSPIYSYCPPIYTTQSQQQPLRKPPTQKPKRLACAQKPFPFVAIDSLTSHSRSHVVLFTEEETFAFQSEYEICFGKLLFSSLNVIPLPVARIFWKIRIVIECEIRIYPAKITFD